MEKFKDILRRASWGIILRDLVIAVYGVFSIPAIWILYVYDLLDMNKAELIAAYGVLLLVVSIPFVLFVWVIVLLRRKMALGYMYIRQNKRLLINASGIRIYEKVNDKGKSVYAMGIKRESAKDFIVRFMLTYYDLTKTEQELVNDIRKQSKNDYEEMAYEFVQNKYPEWIILYTEE